ncbi:hypothetical protein [Flavobacterium sp. KACC 22763]|uniref:hypothetical protein n=1 Tax=Flavobacterium sp. KACC 22763 TaxID=3025668 RepID=UPI002365AE0F|nr:hypothetical protein [Flavobacterium sp. KACC 22763]WDF63177.1 hypothetical protein PQ463_16340 [Flavobacterium sp. KACC 22763]
MASEIHKLKGDIENSFPNDWLSAYLGEDDKIINRKAFKKLFSNTLKKVVDSFFLSLLRGEYIINTGKKIKELKDLSDFINDQFSFLLENEESQEMVIKHVKVGFTDVIKVYSNLYVNFIKLIELQNKNPNLDILFDVDYDTRSYYEKINETNKDSIRLFDLTIFLFKLDHFFNDTDIVYKNLLQLERNINDFSAIRYTVLIKDKIHFLKFKWEVRQKSYNKNSIKAYIVNNELFITTDVINFHSGSEKIKEWKKYIESYYELDNWKNNLRSQVNLFKHKKFDVLCILQLLQLLKFYKDVDSNIYNLSEVVNEFHRRFIKNEHTEQRYIYNKIYLYALNNQFSLLLMQNSITDLKINELREEIEKIQSKCNIDNFFIDFKYISYKLDQLNKKFEKREEFEDFAKEKTELDNLETAIKSYKHKLGWSKNNHNLLYQLPYKESLVESSINDLSIYYASSIVLPLSLEESENNFQIISDKYKRLNQLVLSVSSLGKEFDTIKDIKSNEIKTLEIIGIFTAITAFILASIPSFTFVKDFNQALLFTGIIGCSLFLMVSLIFLFTRGFKKANTWIVLFSAIILLIISMKTLENVIEKENIKEKSKDHKNNIDKNNKQELKKPTPH